MTWNNDLRLMAALRIWEGLQKCTPSTPMDNGHRAAQIVDAVMTDLDKSQQPRFIIVGYEGTDEHCLDVVDSLHARAVQRLLVRGSKLLPWVGHSADCLLRRDGMLPDRLDDPLCTCGLAKAMKESR
jgi:hypothetical protein